MLFQARIGFLGGTVIFQKGLCTPPLIFLDINIFQDA